MPVMNNPRELGKEEIELLGEGLDIILTTSASATRRAAAQNLLALLSTVHTIWLDLNE